MSKFSTLRTRSITAVFFALAVFAGLFGGIIPYTLLWCFVGGAAAWEVYNMMMPKDDLVSSIEFYFFGLLAILCGLAPSIYHLIENTQALEGLQSLANAKYICAFGMVLLLTLWSKHPRAFERLGVLCMIVFYIGLPTYLVLNMGYNAQVSYQAVLSVLLLTWANDSFAYLVGSLIGKNKFWPKHSPNKTWEGTIGGLLLCMGAGALIGLYIWPALGVSNGIILAAIVGVTGSLGDLAESMLKRQMGVKDAGKLLPGHGGVLDRFDAFIVSIPFAYVFLSFLGLVG